MRLSYLTIWFGSSGSTLPHFQPSGMLPFCSTPAWTRTTNTKQNLKKTEIRVWFKTSFYLYCHVAQRFCKTSSTWLIDWVIVSGHISSGSCYPFIIWRSPPFLWGCSSFPPLCRSALWICFSSCVCIFHICFLTGLLPPLALTGPLALFHSTLRADDK